MWPNACFQKRKHLLYINNQSDYTKEKKSKSNCQMHWTKPFCTFSFTGVPRNPHLNSTLFSGAVIPYKFIRNCKRESSFTCSLLPLESNGAASTTSRTLCLSGNNQWTMPQRARSFIEWWKKLYIPENHPFSWWEQTTIRTIIRSESSIVIHLDYMESLKGIGLAVSFAVTKL